MNDKKPIVPFFALWEMPSGKGFSGKLGNARVLVLRNDRKKNPKEPDYRVFLAEDDWKQGRKQDEPAPNPQPVDDSEPPF